MMAGKPWKRPTAEALHLAYEDVVSGVTTAHEEAARFGANIKTLRMWWQSERLCAPFAARQRRRHHIIRAVLARHPDARTAELTAAVRKEHPGVCTRTVCSDQALMGVPTVYERRRREIVRLLHAHPEASRKHIHETMRAGGWSANAHMVGVIMRDIRERGDMSHYQRQAAAHTANITERHELLRKVLDREPSLNDAELAERLTAAGHAVAGATVCQDRQSLGIPSMFRRRLDEARAYTREHPSLMPCEVLACMQADGWKVKIGTVKRAFADAGLWPPKPEANAAGGAA